MTHVRHIGLSQGLPIMSEYKHISTPPIYAKIINDKIKRDTEYVQARSGDKFRRAQ